MDKDNKIIYKALSYKIVGILFDVFNQLGAGHNEKFYEKAVSHGLVLANLKFKNQVPAQLFYKGVKIGQFYIDFLIENKIILEIKVGRTFSKQNFNQIIEYLKVTNRKLAILATFSFSGVKFIRLLNSNNAVSQASEDLKLANLRKLFYL